MNIIKFLKKIIFWIITLIYKLAYKLIKTDNHTILFMSYLGRGYVCNPKYIYEEIIKDNRFKDFTFIWVLKDDSTYIKGAKVIKYRSFKYFYYLAKSKFWIMNAKLPEYCLKKEDQIYIQTWHGTPLKRLAHDINLKKDTTFYRSKQTKEEMLRSYDVDVAKYNYLISPNSYSTKIFEHSFKINKNKIREYGYPRNDYLVNITNDEIELLKEKLNIPKNKKVLLYAPTWRDNSFNDKGYVFELKVDFNKWKKELNDEWVILFKPHYLISNKFNFEELDNFVIPFRENIDINKLYVVSDMLVTDYSSVFFDYSILNRPIAFYMYDMKEYKEELRGFYLDINKDLPGPIAEDEDELLRIIKDNICNNDIYINKKFRSIFNEDGNASKKIINELILPLI